MEWVVLWQLLQLETLMVGHGGSSAGSYLTDPTSPIPSHCAVILFKSVPVQQLLWLALLRLTVLILIIHTGENDSNKFIHLNFEKK